MKEIEISYSDATLLYAAKVLKKHCKRQHFKNECINCLFNVNGCLLAGIPELWPNKEKEVKE